ncbi:hypothetical protein EW146_g2650 [Bondarzewia mesenterica]|uniref:Uncharacterized protein n=1 Tax=Bondarzewia mesenterica TaxID=1095465 RepID=A0A4S4M2A4_9AGAM|nr:hypothetical protein EW146_g2650 [Bondarzewia mesenterica]
MLRTPPRSNRFHSGEVPYTINTEYVPDETSTVDVELSYADFGKKIEKGMRLHEQREPELMAEATPLLLPRPKTAAAEEGVSTFVCRSKVTPVNHGSHLPFEQVMQTLRRDVQQLEENELVDSAMLRGSQVALESQPSSNDVGSIMQSMMGPPSLLSTPRSVYHDLCPEPQHYP